MKRYTPILLDACRVGPGQYASSSTVSKDGRILVNVGGRYSLFSEDRGVSFKRLDLPDVPAFHRLSDGSYVAFSFHNQVLKKFNPIQKPIPYVMKIMRAASFEDILSGHYACSFSSVDIPDLAVGYGDSGDKDNYHTGVIDHGVVEMPNGDIIITMYGQFEADVQKVDYFDKYDFFQYRSWCLISHDGCKTFSYLSTIADCQSAPIDPRAEGYCEPDLLHVGDGHLVAVLRTGGHEVYTPMYVAHSYDSGKTWEKPFKIHDFGVFPKLIKLQNGSLVCSAGKIGSFLLFSSDDGLTWSEPIYICDNDGQWDRGPSGYTTLLETAPNEILVIYDETEDKTSIVVEKPEDRRIVFIHRYKIETTEA